MLKGTVSGGNNPLSQALNTYLLLHTSKIMFLQLQSFQGHMKT